jgi:hypothetical protein
MKKRKEGHPEPPATIRRTKADIATDQLERAFRTSQGMEMLALHALDEKLATGFLELLPAALAAAKADKPDTRLLRLITRFTASRNRFLQAKHAKR